MTEWNVPQSCIFDYLNACKSFVEDDNKFNNFKQDSRYKVILEHVSLDESNQFISEMKNLEILTEDQIEKFKENDIYGNPEIFEYEKFGNISPSTIRYIKNTLDIFNHFSSENIKDIVEIGGGYGGLCKTMSVLFDYDNYVIIDLPEVSKLSKKYISNFLPLKDKVQQLNFNELDVIENIDLVISNYAFSECSLDIQKKYYNDVIRNSNKFYLVYNNITPGNMNSDQFFNYASKDFNIEVEEEIRTYFTNYIFYGTKK
jgi:putative sugar O-methyltransferase